MNTKKYPSEHLSEQIKPYIDVNADSNPHVKASQQYMKGERVNQIPTDKLERCLNQSST